MSGSFVAGNFSRDYITIIAPDPVKEAAREVAKEKLAEEKAKEKAKLLEEQAKKEKAEKRAKELATVNPKDYTSSMYLDSLILKGQADNMTSIKLKKIDNVSNLDQFPKLKRIRLYDMKGNEDLSVIQKLKGVEEILIESSVLKNQFAKGDFKTVKYLEMFECTVEDTPQFTNFKNVTEFYADSTKFVSKDGNLKAPSYMPSLETLTLSNCGEYAGLPGVQNLKKLKDLTLESNTSVKNTSYVQNPQIESLTVDISFATSSDQLMALSNLKNLTTLTLQRGKSPLSSSELSAALEWISSQHPNVSIKITK